MAYVERVQTVIVDETTGAVVAQGAGYAALRRLAGLTVAQQGASAITSPVTVTGVPAVGEVLTAVIAPNWTVTGYKWYADGVEISGATADTFTITVAQQGAVISVGVTGLTFIGGSIAIPADIEAVGTLVVVGFVEGTTNVVDGETLVAELTATDADGEITVAYQWQEDIGGVWTDIALATTDSLTVATADVGKVVRVVATTTDVNGATTAFVSDGYTVIAA